MTRGTSSETGPSPDQSAPAVVLLSGGLDSYTTAAIARSQGFRLYALTVDYGQRHGRELTCARRVAEVLGVREHKVISLDLRLFGGSALTDSLAVPKTGDPSGSPPGGNSSNVSGRGRSGDSGSNINQDGSTGNRPASEPADSSAIPVTYVPARNTILLSLALGWAEVVGAYDLFIGANAVDYSGYPDCRPEYLEAFETLANLATKAGVEGQDRFRLHAPLVHLSKAEIIRRGIELGVDYSLTHSCYDPDPDNRACGRCDSCRLRLKGFQQAGVHDPIDYAGA